jgi:hypothetical protein
MPTNSNSTTVKIGGTPTSFSNEACTKVTANTVYQITDATKRVLDPNTALTVEVDADGPGGGAYATAAPSTYTVDYMFGKVTFTADQGSAATVRISGKYIPVSIALIEGTDFEVEDMGDLVEKTVFGDTARSRFLTLQDASGSFSVISSLSSTYNATTLRALMRAGTPVLLEYRPGGSTAYWRAWVLLSDGSEKASVDGRIEGSMKFEAVTVGPSTGESEYAVPTWGT